MSVYIIAEAGVNHNGSVETALKLIDEAKEAGADAIKFQTFTAESLVTENADMAEYQKTNLESNIKQFEMIKKLELSKENHFKLFDYCKKINIDFLSSPFDEDSFNFLSKDLNLSCIKLGSGEITNAPLLVKIGKEKKDLILSTGMSTLGEVEFALACLAFGYLDSNLSPTLENFLTVYSTKEAYRILSRKVVLLHCTSNYPATAEEVNLRAIATLKESFDLKVGYSDHTTSLLIPSVAVGLGATMIEKHFTLDKNMVGPDHKASISPSEFKYMVEGIRETEEALGDGRKIFTKEEVKNRNIARKSLYAAKDIKKGEQIQADGLNILRPVRGSTPISYWSTLEKIAQKEYKKNDPI